MDLANIFYGAEQGVDEYTKVRQQGDALKGGAQLFANLGTEEAMGYADLMHSDPQAAIIFAREFGGVSSLYEVFRQNALLGMSRGANRAAARVLGPEYEDVARAGGDPLKVAEANAALIKARNTGSGSKTYDHPALAGILASISDEPTEDEYAAAVDMAVEAGIPVNELNKALSSRPKGPTRPQPTQNPSPFQMESSIRADFLARAGADDYRKRREAYKTAEEGFDLDHAGGDLQLVYNAIKLWDPNSVREGEIELAKGTAGLPDYLANAWEMVQGGKTRLPPDARRALISSVRSSFSAITQQFEELEGEYRGMADSWQLDSRRTIPDYLGKYRGGANIRRPFRGGSVVGAEGAEPPAAPSASGLAPGQKIMTDDATGEFFLQEADGTLTPLRR